MNTYDVESSPMLATDEQLVEPRTFNKSVRASIALGSLLTLACVAAIAYTNPTSLKSTISTMSLEAHDQFAECKNTYIDSLTPRIAEEGCVIFANTDLFGWKARANAIPTTTICLGSAYPKGEFLVNFDKIKEMGVTSLAGISPGHGVDVEVYTGDNFDGETAYIANAEEGRLIKKKFPDGILAEGSIKSLKIIVDISGFFAGKSCGIPITVCPSIAKGAAVTSTTPPDGCITLANIDPESKGHEKSNAKIVTICANNDVGTVGIGSKQLTNMGMKQKRSKQESYISWAARGKLVNFVEMFENDAFAGGNTQGTGSFSREEYQDGTRVADNVNSLEFSSQTPSVTSFC